MDKAKQQMEFLFEEGGMADDGLDRDPVSGNEVPSGSMSEEVRDDIPAQLSEGEYVVPADVVRYYGVRFFEDLREDAKEGLTGMEREGRIGGEPVDMEGDDTDLSDEEMAELESIMGMALGGYVDSDNMPRLVDIEEVLAEEKADPRSLYDMINDPTLLIGTPEGAVATTPEMKRDLLRKMGLIQIASAGMAVGGYVTEQPTQATDPYTAQTELYRSPAPVAIGNTDGMQTRGYQEGGAVPSIDPDFSQFGAGFSFMGSDVTQAMPTTQPAQQVTLYGPNGQVVNLTLPAQQSQYDLLISQGYSTQPVAQVQTPTVQAPQQQQNSGGDEYMSPQEYQRELNRIQTGSSEFSVDEFEYMQSNPLDFAERQLNTDTTGLRIATGLAGILGGPLGAIGGGAAYTAGVLDPVAKTRAALEVARAQGADPARIASLEERLTARIEDLPFTARMAMDQGAATGSRYKSAFDEYVGRMQAISNFDRSPERPSYLGNATGMDITRAVNKAASELSGPAADDYARSQASGRTGSAARDVAVGNISGVNGVAGVVADPNTGKVVRDPLDNKTIFRDTEGRTYVRTGFLGRGIEYRDVPNVEQSSAPPPETTENVDTGNGDNQSGNDNKIICTAMNASYGFGSYRQAIWLQYSDKHLTKYHEKGYHKLFLPLVRKAYYSGEKNSKIIRAILEHGTRHRTADLRAEMQGKKRDTLGRIYRGIFEPICYVVGRFSK